MAQLTGINIQMKSSVGVFRAYVKQISINDREENKGKESAATSAIYIEKSLTPNEPISTAFSMLKENTRIDKDSVKHSLSGQ